MFDFLFQDFNFNIKSENWKKKKVTGIEQNITTGIKIRIIMKNVRS